MTFVKQTTFGVDYSPTHITKWRSSRTGLQICYINQPSPLVKGYFAVATECTDDSGLPHTLEHLVFMGSHKYPYKGLLDTLGNRFFLETNASTYVDKTVYTLSTAGWEGFKTLLPIYLDHLMNPTLTDEACLTEVYHISGEGKERGVVFLEMQGIESQSWFVGMLASQRTLFPAESGYSSESGGLTNELRTLQNQRIIDYHKAMYRPDNLSVIITGTVDEKELLEVMEEFDSELPELGVSKHKRPFVDSVNPTPIVPLKENIVKEVEFPEEDESTGEVYMSWIGPKFDDPVLKLAMDIVAGYFTDSEISLFDKNLIEIETPLVSDIEFSMDEYLNVVLNFTFNGVPTDKLREVEAKLKELIKSVSTEDQVDVEYFRQLIEQQKLRIIGYTELSPALFKKYATEDFVYGDVKDTELLSKFSKDLSSYDVLMSWDANKWADIIKTWFIENKSISILNKPSAKLHDTFKKEKKLIAKGIKTKYGKEGLVKLGEELEHAKEVNDKPIPDEILTQFGKPDPSKIKFINTESYKAGTNDEAQYDTSEQKETFVKKLSVDGSSASPLFFHFENYKSQFTDLDIVMPTSNIDPDLLRYIPILREIFSLPLKEDDGSIMPYEEVIQKLNEDFLLCYATSEFNTFSELIRIKLSFQTVKYNRAIDWLTRCMFHSIFDEKRVKVLLEKLVSSIPSKKRNEEEILESATNRTLFTEKSIKKAQDFLFTETFLKECLEKIENGDYKSIQDELESLRSQVFQLETIKLFFVGNCEGLENPISAWGEFIKTAATYKSTTSRESNSNLISSLPHSYEYLSNVGNKCSKYAHLATTSASDSTHLNVSTKISTDPLHEDIKKIELVSAFLSATEGPFWKGIRGEGVAYLCWTSRDLETGLLSFRIYRGSDPQQVLTIAKEIVDDFCTGKKKFDKIGIDNAIAQIVLEYAQREANHQQAANSKILQNILRKTGPNYPTKSLKQLNELTENDLVYALKKYFKPLFSSENSIIFSCVPGDKIESFKKYLEEDGYNVVVEEIQAEAGGEDEHDHEGCESCDDHDEETDSEVETDSEEETESESEEDEDED